MASNAAPRLRDPAPAYAGPTLVPSAPPEPTPWRVFALLVAAALLPRLIAFFFTENVYGDAVVRTELAEKWAAHPHWISSFDDGAWQFGPLHLYLLGVASMISSAREHAGRVVSLLLGTLTVVPLYALTRRYFGSKNALAAALGFCAWGMQIQFSTTAASEALGLFLMLSVLALFAWGRAENRFSPIAAAAVLLNLACATRYDAWMLIPLLTGALLLGDKDRIAALSRALFFGLMCLPFPLLWMHGNELTHGDPFYPIHFIDDFHRRWFHDGVALWGNAAYRAQNLFFWPGAAVVTLSPLVALFGIAGMVVAWRRHRPVRWLLWIILLPAAYFTFRSTVMGSFVPLARFAAVQIALVLPFVGIGFDALLGRFSAPVRRAALVATAVVAVALPLSIGVFTWGRDTSFAETLRPVSPVTTNPPALMQVARFIRDHAAAAPWGAIIDSDPNYRDIQLRFFSGLPLTRLARLRNANYGEILSKIDPHVLVRFDGGGFAQAPDVELSGARVRLGSLWFDEVPGFAAPFHVYAR